MYKFVRLIFTIYCYVFNRFRVYGRENEPKEGPVIVYCNHQSMFDVFPLNLAIKRPINFMAKASLFNVPVVNWFVKKYGAFPVDREKADLSAIKNSLKTLKSERILGIFPEGTRVKNGLTKEGKAPEIKPGFVMIAQKSKATMLPVRIYYKRLFFIFNDIRVYIGKPFLIEEEFNGPVSSEDFSKAGTILMDKIYQLGNETK